MSSKLEFYLLQPRPIDKFHYLYFYFLLSEKSLKEYELDNVINVKGEHELGYAKHAPYDLIIFLGSTNRVKTIFFDQLALKGKLLVCQTINEVQTRFFDWY